MAIDFEKKLREMIEARAERERIEREEEAVRRRKRDALDAKARDLCAQLNDFIGPRGVTWAGAYGSTVEITNRNEQLRIELLENDLYCMTFKQEPPLAPRSEEVVGDEDVMMEAVVKWLKPDARI